MPSAIDQHTRIPSGVVPPSVYVDVPPPPRLGMPDASDEAPHGKPIDNRAHKAPVWTIYSLTHWESGRIYVGLTRRPLAERMQSHVQQAKRDRRVRSGGLMSAIQETLARAQTFAQAFKVEAVATADTKADAQAAERDWIERLGSRHPLGLNGMPGGSSVGGVDNARPVTFKLRGVRHEFATIQSAVDWANGQLQEAGRLPVDSRTVYARLAMKWPPSQALGLVPHRDGRGARDTFVMNGKSYKTLAEASAKSGIPIPTLRSRLHRQRVSGIRMDLSIDRRQALGPHGPRTPRQVPATPPTEPREPMDRRKLLVLVLPNGSRLIGGEREVISQVLSNPRHETKRVEHLSASGIRRRLRLLDDYDRLVGSAVAWAFGFGAAPPPYVPAAKPLHR